jgi:molecular chaperone DnaK
MSDIVGIDLGTTNSLIGVMDAGFPVLLADANGERLTPSIVYFPPEGESLVGAPAARMRMLKPRETIASAKRFIGLRAEEVTEQDHAAADYELVGGKGEAVGIRAGGRDRDVAEISALVLRKLKADAELALGRELSRAVITVPAYFNDAQRSATKRAGETAGFTVERIINEPTAAALAYGLDRLGEKSKIAVYDLGGGTFDISILELNGGVFQVLATNGNTRLGGDDIDRALVDWLVAEAGDRLRDADLETLARVREAAVAAKHRLSTVTETSVEVPFVTASENFSVVLSRSRLEELSRPIVDRTRFHCQRALADAQLRPDQLDQVILVGGATRMPIVQQLVSEVFDQPPNISQNPDEAVGIGATIQAGILAGVVRDVVLLDVTPLSLGIETFGGLMNVIIPRNSTIPTKAGEMFTTAVHNQRSMLIKVLQGEREMARDNWRLGQFEIDFAPGPKGAARVGVQFEIDANGILHVLARDTATGAEKIVEINSAIDVSDEAVEAMLADSLEHAFEDVNERIRTEAQLKAKEMLAAVDAAFELLGDEIDAAERQEIVRRADEVRAASDSEETARLKKANEALDHATQPLAARVVEKVMHDAEQRREAASPAP